MECNSVAETYSQYQRMKNSDSSGIKGSKQVDLEWCARAKDLRSVAKANKRAATPQSDVVKETLGRMCQLR